MLTIFRTLLLALTLLVTLSSAYAEGPTLTPRQAQAALTDPSCQSYSRTANLSTIGKNSTYRSAFYSRSLSGSMYDNRMFSEAILAIPALTADQALNNLCGNLTEVALTEAEANFTRATVAQFDGIVVEGIKAGPEVMVIVGAVVVLFFGVWSFMP